MDLIQISNVTSKTLGSMQMIKFGQDETYEAYLKIFAELCIKERTFGRGQINDTTVLHIFGNSRKLKIQLNDGVRKVAVERINPESMKLPTIGIEKGGPANPTMGAVLSVSENRTINLDDAVSKNFIINVLDNVSDLVIKLHGQVEDLTFMLPKSAKEVWLDVQDTVSLRKAKTKRRTIVIRKIRKNMPWIVAVVQLFATLRQESGN